MTLSIAIFFWGAGTGVPAKTNEIGVDKGVIVGEGRDIDVAVAVSSIDICVGIRVNVGTDVSVATIANKFARLTNRDTTTKHNINVTSVKAPTNNHTKCEKMDEIQSLIRLWKMYAKEYNYRMNEKNTSYLAINFNSWVTSKKYRKTLSSKLNLPFNDNSCSKWVTKSIFGEDLNILRRWEYVKDDCFFRIVASDNELKTLNRQIFSYLPPLF